MNDNHDGPDDEVEEMDVADEVSFADTGRSWAHRAIKHPSHSRTRRYFAVRPFPGQREGGAV
jgi:hypothetical protein